MSAALVGALTGCSAAGACADGTGGSDGGADTCTQGINPYDVGASISSSSSSGFGGSGFSTSSTSSSTSTSSTSTSSTSGF